MYQYEYWTYWDMQLTAWLTIYVLVPFIVLCKNPEDMFNSTVCYTPYQNYQNWQAAREFCTQKNGDLISINDVNIQKFVAARVSTILDKQDFWIGAFENGSVEVQGKTLDFVLNISSYN